MVGAGVGAGVTVRFGFRRRAAASAPSSSPSSRVASWFASDARMWSVYLGGFDLGHLRLDGEGWGGPFSDDQPTQPFCPSDLISELFYECLQDVLTFWQVSLMSCNSGVFLTISS